LETTNVIPIYAYELCYVTSAFDFGKVTNFVGTQEI